MTITQQNGRKTRSAALITKPQESNFTVTVRVRPLMASEESETNKPTITAMDDHVLIFDPSQARANRYRKGLKDHHKRTKEIRYAFDRVFADDCPQSVVFEHTTKSLITGVLDGYNATVFAYGATGAGKTHTMAGTPTDPGIMVLTMCELFDKIQNLKEEKIIEVKLTYLEIYNEMIRDLLVETPAPLELREDAKNGITIAGLSEHEPQNVQQVMELLRKGNANRMMSPTQANATSSRSHAVLQIHIKQKERTANISSEVQYAVLSLIDLAGSERASVTQNKGERIREGANINRSLLALGNCINALCASKKPQHIPYRDSKLTRLLKYSLGGNCRTVMVAAVSPYLSHYEDTYNTLIYANRAKNIKTTLERNTMSVHYHIKQYVQIIADLRLEIEELKAKVKTNETVSEEKENQILPDIKSKMKMDQLIKQGDDLAKEAMLFESHQAMLTEDIMFHENQIEKVRFLLKALEMNKVRKPDLILKLETSLSILEENLDLLQFDLTVLFDEIDRHEALILELRNKCSHLQYPYNKLLEEHVSKLTLNVSKTRHECFGAALQKTLDNQRIEIGFLMNLFMDKNTLESYIDSLFRNEKMLESIEHRLDGRLSAIEERFSTSGRASVAEKRQNMIMRNESRISLKPAVKPAFKEPDYPKDALTTWKDSDPREMIKMSSPTFKRKSVSRSLTASPISLSSFSRASSLPKLKKNPSFAGKVISLLSPKRKENNSSVFTAPKVIEDDAKSINNPFLKDSQTSANVEVNQTQLPDSVSTLQTNSTDQAPIKSVDSSEFTSNTSSQSLKFQSTWKKFFLSSVRSPPRKKSTTQDAIITAESLDKLSDEEDNEGLKIIIGDRNSNVSAF